MSLMTSCYFFPLPVISPSGVRLSVVLLPVVVPALVDRLGDSKDQVRENSQTLILRCMEQTASPMVRQARQHALTHTHAYAPAHIQTCTRTIR